MPLTRNSHVTGCPASELAPSGSPRKEGPRVGSRSVFSTSGFLRALNPPAPHDAGLFHTHAAMTQHGDRGADSFSS